ncbi:P-type conjugative transfer protein TrbL [Variovorax sp.]|uniref:P-type conjugative transfer protein TrbL n=1 Tax=Variovorax sp. TaxID=1871043 RepID=UPI0037DA72B5
MNDISVIDRFLDVFSRYIDSGFGLLRGEVAFLSATLIVIDVTLAGLFWAMSHAGGGSGDDVIAKLLKKVLYVGAFAWLIGNYSALAGILFRSFAELGLTASGSGLSPADLVRPGRLAKVGVDAARPIMSQISDLSGFPEVFVNFDIVVVLLLAWLVLIVAFFVLAVQLFVTLLEFKLTTLAGFVLVPFALWNRTAFLAEKVLGNVVSSGIKVLVLAVIVGIGGGLFGEFTAQPGTEPSIDHALTVMLAALAMLGLGIFGPGIATGLVSGAPQLGAGAAAATTIGAAGLAVAGGAAAVGAGSAIGAGARMAPGAATSTARGAIGAGASAGRAASGLTTGARAAYRAAAAQATEAGKDDPISTARAGVAGVARAGAAAAGQHVIAGARAARDKVAGFVASAAAAPAASDGQDAAAAPGNASATQSQPAAQPDWAKRLQRGQRLTHGVGTAAHVLRSSDHGGGGAGPSLRDDSNPS